VSIVTPDTSPARPPRDRGRPVRGGFDDLPLFRRNDPETSRRAGANALNFARGHQARILAALAAGPGTKDDVAERCGLSDQQVIRRMADLRRKGLVSPGTGSGRSVTGNRETVWRLTEPMECSSPPGRPAARACGQSR
jgi:hypothetical protein